MPSRTLEDKVEELTKLGATLSERLDNLRAEVKGLDLGGLATRLALLEKELQELKKGRRSGGVGSGPLWVPSSVRSSAACSDTS